MQVNPCPGINDDEADCSPLLMNNVPKKIAKNNSSLSLHSRIVDVTFDADDGGKPEPEPKKKKDDGCGCKGDKKEPTAPEEDEEEKAEAEDTVDDLPTTSACRPKTSRTAIRNMSREELEEKLQETSSSLKDKFLHGTKRKR